jgi:hypothetical protein
MLIPLLIDACSDLRKEIIVKCKNIIVFKNDEKVHLQLYLFLIFNFFLLYIFLKTNNIFLLL